MADAWDSDGGYPSATAGVGMAPTMQHDGIVHIRPYLPYEGLGTGSAFIVSSVVMGHCEVVVQDAGAGATLTPVGYKYLPLWRHETHSYHRDEYYGPVYPTIEMSVQVRRGQRIFATFLATAIAQAAGTGLGFGAYSLSYSSLKMKVPFFVLEMGN